MNDITVNGKSVSVPDGHSVCIMNGEVLVDGRRYTENESLKQINITIEGGCESLQVDHCDRVEVKGDVRGSLNTGGSVTVHGNVGNDVDAGGSVTCGNVSGNVDAKGSVTCGNISGDVDVGGSVFHT
ncbi:hypothetical protein IKG06_01670 [Candidatus Saccharibacteria bacterium]|nr:hypothetical protein [Candidatus Saccharibacteria bacterium]